MKIHPERIIGKDKELGNDLYYEGIEFPLSKNNFNKVEKKNNVCIRVLCYEN